MFLIHKSASFFACILSFLFFLCLCLSTNFLFVYLSKLFSVWVSGFLMLYFCVRIRFFYFLCFSAKVQNSEIYALVQHRCQMMPLILQVMCNSQSQYFVLYRKRHLNINGFLIILRFYSHVKLTFWTFVEIYTIIFSILNTDEVAIQQNVYYSKGF